MRQNRSAVVLTNLECAKIILAVVERYGGEEALMVQWARLVSQHAVAQDAGAGPRFRDERREGGNGGENVGKQMHHLCA